MSEPIIISVIPIDGTTFSQVSYQLPDFTVGTLVASQDDTDPGRVAFLVKKAMDRRRETLAQLKED